MSPSAVASPARRFASRAARSLSFALVLLAAAPLALAAQETVCDPGDVEVRALDFEGNETFDDAELSRGIAVTPSSWIRRTLGVFGTRRCVERAALRLDVARLAIYYRKRGFLQAQVDTVVREVGEDAIAVRFVVDEGPALRVDTLTVSGLEAVPPAVVAGDLGLRVGDRFDQYVIDSARYVLVRRLRDGGYPFADVLSGFRTHTATRSAAVELDAIPGPLARLGEITLDVVPREGAAQQVPDDVVRGLLGIRAGQRYR